MAEIDKIQLKPDGPLYDIRGANVITKIVTPNIDEVYDACFFHTNANSEGTFPMSGSSNHTGAGVTLPFRKSSGNEKPDYAGQIWIPAGNKKQGSIFFRTSHQDEWDPWCELATPASYVIEEGISNGWEYRKWSNGSVDLWTYKSITVDEDSTSGNLHYSKVIYLDMPFPVYPIQGSSNHPIIHIEANYLTMASNTGTTTTNRSQLYFRLIKGTSFGTGATNLVSISVHGKLTAPLSLSLGAPTNDPITDFID